MQQTVLIASHQFDSSVYITNEQFHAADSVTQTDINNVFSLSITFLVSSRIIYLHFSAPQSIHFINQTAP